ncbi:MAG: ABC transporter permease [Chloroflexi bacterium]|nr:ABC transporter permease [Chloroflexota bacterium]
MIVGFMVGAMFATATAAGIPQYSRSMEVISMRAAVEDVGDINTNVHINSSWIPLSAEDHFLADTAVFSATNTHLGDLVQNTTGLVKSREHWWGWLDQPMRKDGLASLSAFQYIENFNDHVDYIEGVAPTDTVVMVNGEATIEVAVFHDRATALQISVGDVINSQPIDRGTGLVRSVVTGTFEQTDSSEVFWLQLGEVYLAPAIEGREQPLIMLPTSNSMFTEVAEANTGLPASYDWFIYTDQSLLAEKSVAELESAFEGLKLQLEDTIARPFVITEMIPRIESMKKRALFGSVPLLLLALLILACVAFYLTMTAGLLGRRRVSGYMMLRSRGFNIRQQLWIHVVEATVISVPAAIVAPIASLLAIRAFGYLPTYNSITGGSMMPVELSPSTWIWSFSAAIGTVLVVTASSSFWDRSTMAASRSSDARPTCAPWFQRFYIDALLVALSGIVWWEVSARSTVVVSEREGEFTPDISLLAAPVLIVMASSLVALRLFPIITRVLARVGLKSNSTALGLGLISVARRPFFHGWPMLAFALSISTAIVAGSVVSTLEQSTNEQVLYSTASDIHVTTTGTTGQVDRDRLEKVRNLESIDVATPALRTGSTVGTTSIGSYFTLLAIDPIDFQQVAWFRDDFSDSDVAVHQMVDRLAVRVLPQSIELPPNTSEISIWAKSEPLTPNHELWIVVKDGINDTHTINMGLFTEGWFRTTGTLSKFPEPIQITSIQTFLKVGPDSAPPINVFVDDLIAITADGQNHLVLDFDLPELWTGLPTTEGQDTGFTITPEPDGVSGIVQNDVGTGVGNISLGRGSNQGIRGIYRSAVDRPIPLIASQTFMDQTGVGLRRPFAIDVQGGLVPVEVIDTIKYFPTLDPNRGPFAIADIDAIIDFIELRGRRSVTPNELFASLNTTDLTSEEITENVRSIFRLARINSRAERINSTFVDPIAVAGWRGMSIIATIIACLVVLMAYAVFLAAYSLRTKGDSALILALGASTRNYWVSTVAELLPAILTGILVGIAIGLSVSSLMVASMAHTGTGDQLLPPFMLQTNWMLPLVTITAIFAIVLAGVTNSVRTFHQVEIAPMAREGFTSSTT